MKSRITIEVDFDNGNLPILQILQRSSDDVRDNLLQQFIQSLHHTSRWCRISYEGERSANLIDKEKVWRINTIRPLELPEEIKLMEATIEVDHSYPKWKEGFRASNRLDLMSSAEKSITQSIKEVEGVGADVKLTDAVILLAKARDLVYMYYSEKG